QARAKADTLKELVTIVSTLVDEAKFMITADGISLRAVDPAHVAMVNLKLNKEAFEEYKADESELGIDVAKLEQFLRLAKAGDIIDIVNDEEKRRLNVAVGNTTKRMSLIDTTGMSEPKLPNLNLPAKVSLKIDDISQGIKASESVSDHIALNVTSDSFEMICEGDTDQVQLKLAKDKLLELECEGKVRSLFPLEYFSNMMRAIPSQAKITLNLGNDYPVKIEFKIADGNGDVTYLLAPRIESSD
ncbi:MAG TPA: proliferating cell nuclear antigen (pcna), partial [Thermoplasmata archaeon]|nr:proliferating cell nuclear antigen (pcna) [Thermoplasmata archaeon]